MAFKINEEFVKKFNERKERQELQKLANKYEDYDSESDSESEEEEEELVSSKANDEFLAILKAIRKKDPKIYDPNVEFFKENESEGKTSSKKIKSLKVRNYEGVHVVKLENEQTNEDEEDQVPVRFEENIVPKSSKEKDIAKSFHDILKKGKKEGSETAVVREVEDKHNLSPKIEQELKEEEEDDDGKMEDDDNIEQPDKESAYSTQKFLDDFFRKKKYLESTDDNGDDDDDDASNDEEELEKCELFEHKYNFRYEDPDEEFIKSYPRTIVDTVRMDVNKRAEKRKEADARKKQEKAKRKEELRTLKKLKKKEEMKKLKKLSRVGGSELKPEDIDLDEDFDPSKHDSMMKKLYGKNYYDDYNDEDVTQIDEKILESEDEYEDWDNWAGHQPEDSVMYHEEQEYAEEEEQPQRSNKRRKKDKKETKRLKKSKFAEMLDKNKSKPLFDPTKETFDEYLEKHYSLDFEDIVDGHACRFKYKNVFAADFGLSTDEILAAPDQELNAWVPLKKMSECRTQEEELLYERGIKMKSKQKKRILKSLFEEPEENKDNKKSGEFKKNKTEDDKDEANKESVEKQSEASTSTDKPSTNNTKIDKKNNINTNKDRKRKRTKEEEPGLSEDRLEAYNIQPKKFKYFYAPMLKIDKQSKNKK